MIQLRRSYICGYKINEVVLSQSIFQLDGGFYINFLLEYIFQ